MLDWNQCLSVERVSGKVSGVWLFQGTRVPVKALLVGVFHLFRLPVGHEDTVEAHISDWPSKDPLSWILSRDTATEERLRMDESHVSAPQGPVQVGSEKSILFPGSILELAAHYHSAFAGNFQCFPYFAGESNGRK